MDDRSSGWWEGLVGPGKAIDTSSFRVICISVLGSPYSPTNPTSLNPETGKPYRTSFPTLTPTDLARCHALALKQMGINFSEKAPLHAVVGASLGGMQSLQFASLYSEAVSRVVAISATGRTTPFSVGIRSIQRKAIQQDPHFHGGNYQDYGTIPAKGLHLARELGSMFYRSREEIDGRFDWSPSPVQQAISLAMAEGHHPSHAHAAATSSSHNGGGIHWTKRSWEVESWMDWQGYRFIRSYDANCYLLLSKCMDLQNLGDGADGRMTFAQGAARITAKALLIGTKQDALIPAEELRCLAELINSKSDTTPQRPCSAKSGENHNDDGKDDKEEDGKQARYVEISSKYGHDAFLKDTSLFEGHLRRFLGGGEGGGVAAKKHQHQLR
jgi:homoserine O-acetyltransferase/O-succinyltransferase